MTFTLQQKKEAEKKEREEMGALFRPVHEPQKVSAGADPKSVLCVFFKQGQCRKGDKCKFSHDLELEGRAEKKSLYVDTRDLEEGEGEGRKGEGGRGRGGREREGGGY